MKNHKIINDLIAATKDPVLKINESYLTKEFEYILNEQSSNNNKKNLYMILLTFAITSLIWSLLYAFAFN